MNKPLQILIVFIFLAVCPKLKAQDYLAGARFIGLSNASVSLNDTWSTFHNQATFSTNTTFSAGIFYESRFLLEEFSLSAFSFIVPSEFGNFGFSFLQFGQGTFKQQKYGAAYAKTLGKKLAAALQFDYFTSRYPENEKHFGFATFEAGLCYQTTEHITIGLHLFNPINNGFHFPEGKQALPSRYRIGGHYQFSKQLLLAAELEKQHNHPCHVKTGLEFMPFNNVSFRAGVSGKPFNYTAGIGYQYKNITTDIGFSYHGNLGITPSVSLQFQRE